MARKTRADLRLWFGIFIVWLVIFWLSISHFGFNRAVEVLAQLDFFELVLAASFFFMAIMTSVMNWRFILRVMHVKVKGLLLSKIMLAGLFVDNILPNVTPSGEMTMSYLLSKNTKVPLSKSLASIVVYMLSWFFGLIALAILVLLNLLLTDRIPQETAIITSLMLIPFVIIFLLISYIAINAKSAKKIIFSIVKWAFKWRYMRKFRHSEKRLLRWIDHTINNFNRVFLKYFKDRKPVFVAGLIMLLHHFFVSVSFYYVVLAFGADISYGPIAGIFIFIALVSLLSFIPGQLVIYEVFTISLLSLTIGVIDSALVTNVIRLIQYWSIVFIGGFFALKLGLRTVKQRRV
jgi:uncharacterized protein (TIRG00374 family)